MERLTPSSVKFPELRFAYHSSGMAFAEVRVAPETCILVLPEATAKDTRPEFEPSTCVQGV